MKIFKILEIILNFTYEKITLLIKIPKNHKRKDIIFLFNCDSYLTR